MANLKFIRKKTAPDRVEGTIWFDTTNNLVKVYNGTSWELYSNGVKSVTKSGDILTITPFDGDSSTINLSSYVNLIEKIKVDDVEQQISDKTVNITLPVTAVSSDDKILTLQDKTISSTLSINYDSTNKKIQLLGKPGTDSTPVVISEISAADFVKDGMLHSAELQTNPTADRTGTFLVLTFNSDSGITEPLYVNVTSLIDVYTAGTGITISDHVISVNNATITGWITEKINGLDVTDTATDGQFVTRVSQNDGKISVARKSLAASDIPSGIGATKIVLEHNPPSEIEETEIDSSDSVENAIFKLNAKLTDVGTVSYAALQNIKSSTTNVSDYVKVAVEEKNGSSQAIGINVTTQSVSTASESAKGLAEASDVKSYVDSCITSSMTWAEFE